MASEYQSFQGMPKIQRKFFKTEIKQNMVQH